MMLSVSRLVEYIEYKQITKSEFYKATGLSNGYLDKVKDIGTEKLVSIISAYPDLDLKWVVTGQGKMISNESEAAGMDITTVKKLKTDRRITSQAVPLYDIVATAGIVDLLADHKAKHVPIDYIKIPNLPKCDGALPITGDSMYPLLKSGDLALYKEVHDMDNIIWGEMYLIALSYKGDDFFFAKYLQRGKKDGWINLVSYNQNHQAKEFPLDSVRALALIKATVRINTQF
jgi:phage repressor protein C with HTH and peptisase S24 domain